MNETTGKPPSLFTPQVPLKIRIMAYFGSYLIWMAVCLLFMTCRLRVFGGEILEKSKAEHGGRMLGGSWHRGLFLTVYFFRNLQAALMTSRSQDGELLTALLRRFGYTPPRGSSGEGKGGKQALEEFIEVIKSGRPAGIAVDGPKGPPYVSKFGVVVAAARTGVPVIPFIWNAESCWRINSWDRTMIPKPFSRLVLAFDREMLPVPAGSTDEELERLRGQLDSRLVKLTYQVDHWFEMESKYSDPREIPVPEPTPLPYHPPRRKKTEKAG
jgi:lysophospholipid acyltransferase (LPLAT)-like uncharacterized protein